MSKKRLILQQPSEKQKLFLAAHTKHVGFGGARGGGKSWAVRDKAKRLCLRFKGIKLLIVRRTYAELINNHINPLREELNGIARYNKTEKIFVFSNGSTIKFGYCNNDKDLDQYQGAEYDVIFLDEATQLQEMWIKKITACVRGVNDFPKRIYYTCNPGGASHGYFKRLFIDKHYEDGENPEDYTFIQSLVTDNKALMEAQPDYIKQLEALPPKLREAWLYGRWDIFEGQFFEDFRTTPDVQKCHDAGITPEDAVKQHRWTHVIEPFDLNKGSCRGWNIMRSYDFGYNKPFSLGYWAVDYDGVLYRILEMYGCTQTPNEGVKWSPDEQFRRMVELENTHPWLKGRKIIDSVADPAIWDSSRGESIADTAAKYGIYFTQGDNQRIPGWMQVHYRLQFDRNGYARMYVFDTCKAFIRTMPLMMYSETHPEDLDTKLEDHCPDEVRYMCMSRPVKPIMQAEQKPILSDPLNQFTEKQLRCVYLGG
ncbi:MAG: phage terminase large subunit [Firmicutes bacterium]|nr:phage terminase large subunit [Bacillota bacterium]MDY6160516.1 phage terminase large subunit [Candidatus Faecousia sp.]